ncbi:hypothetical protein BVH03_10590 [Pseudomonas sp. PA15(2017)]|uniref:type II toxin-antitoxin system RelE/ParE family toxin n=1 Tax=Pseudomonas sp. PA15(2017) TaxID=1932111 RepID=UPI000961A1CB|nr:hypothetical protein BVH03_10590 [Pseudomonas sp. PA15(2017)]
MSYSFHPAAEAELLESVGYYESRVAGLGGTLIREFETLARLISDAPRAWQVELTPDIRKAPLQRFPLSIIYREQTGNVQILAIAHERRRPQYWLNRFHKS